MSSVGVGVVPVTSPGNAIDQPKRSAEPAPMQVWSATLLSVAGLVYDGLALPKSTYAFPSPLSAPGAPITMSSGPPPPSSPPASAKPAMSPVALPVKTTPATSVAEPSSTLDRGTSSGVSGSEMFG